MPAFPDGHFYSPVPDFDDLRRRKRELWPDKAVQLPGVDLDLAGQVALLDRVAGFAADFDYPYDPLDPDTVDGFYEPNGKFERIDARMLFCLLRHLRPRRLIEIGSGFSTLLAADVNRTWLAGTIDITCIDPHPHPAVQPGLPGLGRLVANRVEDVPLDLFARLAAGDVLFIDSSHVVKTGSDAYRLYLEILPRLARGVVIHSHDIFLPFEYPQFWVLEEERAWNEQYLLHALLMHSRGLRVLFSSYCVYKLFPERMAAVFGRPMKGGSFWMEKLV